MDSKAKRFVSALPQANHLRIELVDEARDGVDMRLRYQPSVAALDTNLYHPGSLMTLMDTACGTAAAHVLPGSEACPTLDLRVDFFEPVVGNPSIQSGTEAVLALAKVRRVTRDLVFVECRLIAESTGRDLAAAAATFMRILPDAGSKASDRQQSSTRSHVSVIPGDEGRSIWDRTRNELSDACTTEFSDGGADRESKRLSMLPCSAKPTSLFEILNGIAYAKMLGAEMQSPEHSEALCQLALPAEWRNIGNPQLPALHGGVIAGVMEISGWLGVLQALELQVIQEPSQGSTADGVSTWADPQLVDFSIDYLRAGRLQPLYLDACLIRLGRRVANVEILAWQAGRQTPVAKARAHYLINQD